LIDDETDQIWEFGYRGEGALERHVNGAGIGLYTVKKIVSAHGGNVSARGRRTDPNIVTFTFSIPKEKFFDKPKLL
jgi:signal transduction histidine kinase